MSQKIEKQIGANVRKLREQAGMIQDMLAANLRLAGCDMTRSAVAKIEVGQRHLYPDEILLTRQVLNVTHNEIFAIPHE